MNSTLIQGTNANIILATTLPISLSEVKVELRISDTDTTYNNKILLCIQSAIEYFEKYSKYYIIQQQREILWDYFPVQQYIDFDDANIKSIQSISYYPIDWNGIAARTPLIVGTDYFFAKETSGKYGIKPAFIKFINEFECYDIPQCVQIKINVGNPITNPATPLPYSLKKALIEHITRTYSQTGEDCDDCETSITPKIKNTYNAYSYRENQYPLIEL